MDSWIGFKDVFSCLSTGVTTININENQQFQNRICLYSKCSNLALQTGGGWLSQWLFCVDSRKSPLFMLAERARSAYLKWALASTARPSDRRHRLVHLGDPGEGDVDLGGELRHAEGLLLLLIVYWGITEGHSSNSNRTGRNYQERYSSKVLLHTGGPTDVSLQVFRLSTDAPEAVRGGDVGSGLYHVDINLETRGLRPRAGGGGGRGELLVRHDPVDSHYQGVPHSAGEINLGVRKRSFERDRSVVVILHGNVEHGSRQTLDCVGCGESRYLTRTTIATEKCGKSLGLIIARRIIFYLCGHEQDPGSCCTIGKT